MLPTPFALAAAAELCRVLRKGADEAASLAETWDRSVDPAEADDLCAGLLGRRMEAWAVGLALDEAHLDCADEGDARAPTLAEALDRAQDALDRFDTELEAQTQVLATITGTRLLDNWRAMLAAAYKRDLPWWLDGRLEEAARHSEEEAVRTLPGPAAWGEVRRRSGRSVVTPAPAAIPSPHILSILNYRRFVRQRAIAGAPEPFLRERPIKWVSRDRRFVAYLELPPNGEEVCAAHFFTPTGDPAEALVGESSWLDGVPGRVDSEATSVFSRREPAALPDPTLVLETGDDRALWELVEG